MKLCEICGELPAKVPDRNKMGRPINRICVRCHGLRLKGDIKEIMRLQKKNIHEEIL